MMEGRHSFSACLVAFEKTYFYYAAEERPCKVAIEKEAEHLMLIMAHEIGHWLNMVSHGSKTFPDSHPYFYEDVEQSVDPVLSKHIGSHCKYGYLPSTLHTPPEENSEEMSYTPGTCIMFSGYAPQQSFCPAQRQKALDSRLRGNDGRNAGMKGEMLE